MCKIFPTRLLFPHNSPLALAAQIDRPTASCVYFVNPDRERRLPGAVKNDNGLARPATED